MDVSAAAAKNSAAKQEKSAKRASTQNTPTGVPHIDAIANQWNKLVPAYLFQQAT